MRLTSSKYLPLQLVLINVSDHFNRVRANMDNNRDRVYGCLLGHQTGREVSIINSFELKIQLDADGPRLNEEFLTRKQEQCTSLLHCSRASPLNPAHSRRPLLF